MIPRYLSTRALVLALAVVSRWLSAEDSIPIGAPGATTTGRSFVNKALVFLDSPAEQEPGEATSVSTSEAGVATATVLEDATWPSNVSIRSCEDHAGRLAVMSWNRPLILDGRRSHSADGRHFRVIVRLDCSELPEYGRVTDPHTGRQVSFTCTKGKLANESSYYRFTLEEDAIVSTLETRTVGAAEDFAAYEAAYTRWSNSVRSVRTDPVQSRFLLWFCTMLKEHVTTVEKVTPAPPKFKGRSTYQLFTPAEVAAMKERSLAEQNVGGEPTGGAQ